MNVPIKLLHPDAKLPTRADPGAAGYDLYATESAYIVGTRSDAVLPDSRAIIPTGISLVIPEGYYARIAPRSGLAAKHGIDVLAGVVDSSYRGEIKVILVNLSSEGFSVYAGDRIAQLIIEKCHDADWQVVDTLPESARGAGGFGSSGQ